MKRLNPSIYDTCARLGVRNPDIEVFERVYFGQCAEDYIVLSFLRALASRTGIDLTQARYLEIGANHPVSTSATYLLHIGLGMTGVLVEANEDLVPDLERIRRADTILNVAITNEDRETVDLYVSKQDEISSLSKEFVENWADGTVGLRSVKTVPARRINGVLEEHFADQAPLFLSVDVEGLDMDILQDMDWNRWRPYLVQTEPSDQFIAQNSHGMESFLASQGYLSICKTDVNILAVDTKAL